MIIHLGSQKFKSFGLQVDQKIMDLTNQSQNVIIWGLIL